MGDIIDEIGSLIEDLVLMKFKNQIYDQENNINKTRDERIKNSSIDCYGLTLDIKKKGKNRLRCDIIKDEKNNIYNICVELVEKIFNYNGYEPIKQDEISDFNYELHILLKLIEDENEMISIDENHVVCFIDEESIITTFNNKRKKYYHIIYGSNVEFENMKTIENLKTKIYECKYYDYKNFLKGIDLLIND